MEAIIAALVGAVGVGLPAWWLHRRETHKQKDISAVAAGAIHVALDERMRKHVEFVEGRMERERAWYKDEIERERAECAGSINSLAGRLGIAEARLRDLQRTAGDGGEGRVSPSG